ncbi:MAG TPA: hypothetical protein VJR06_02800 [Nitrososphaerales archaeon]|nr:hypothetical protein [Nitrososphaerales archaeon]
MSIAIDNTATISNSIYYWYQQPANPFVIQNPPVVGIYQPPEPLGVRRRTKELRILPSLKGYDVSLTDAHGNVKSSEYSEEELTKALPDLLAKLKKEPKEE